jgi:hypothetical protein
MLRWLLVSVFLLAAAGTAAMGCGSGVSDSEATLRCKEEQQSKAECVTSASYKQCLACEHECGDSCMAEAKCPEVYSCNDTTPSE